MNQDPMSMMLLLSGLNNFSRNIAGNAPPGGYQQSGAMGDIMPALVQMQRMKAEKEDLAFRREQAMAQQAAAQAAAERQLADDSAVAAALGVDPAMVRLNREKLGENFAERFGTTVTSPGQRVSVGSEELFYNPALKTAEAGGAVVFDPTDGSMQIDPRVAAMLQARAAAGATRVSNQVDARNMDTGYGAMAEIAAGDRAKYAEMSDRLRKQAVNAQEVADIFQKYPELSGPGSNWDQFMREGSALLDRVTKGGGLSPEETEKYSAYKRLQAINTGEGVQIAQELTPVTEVELKLAMDAALGPNSSVPQALVTAKRVEVASKHAADLTNFLDRTQAEMLEEARKGGEAYSPAKLNLARQKWLEENPFPIDNFVSELKDLSKQYPLGGKKAASGNAPAGVSPNAAQYF